MLKAMFMRKNLKAGLANHINEMLEPVRRHFNSSPERKDLLKKVQQMRQ